VVRSPFTLGRDPGCNLVFEAALFPGVAPHHCDIVLDQRAFTLHDRSRQGTLLNDRLVHRIAPLHSGDWIRLGPDGPVLRFVGQAGATRPLRIAGE
jgi:pSer/pThr/pTyr-binding forkhead associated (FHA) protein